MNVFRIAAGRTVLAGLLLAAATVAAAQTARPAAAPPLRVCADPNNLPFSNERGEGFENRIAELMARELGRELQYTWWPQRRGFIRNTLKAGSCDLVIGIPARFEMAQATQPYYGSTYVFVTRRADKLGLKSLYDDRLAELSIGVHAIGDDYSNIPPVEILARRGITHQVRGYSIYGDYSQPDPPRALIDALARGDIDVAIAWGPFAGYFARRAAVPMDVVPLPASDSTPLLPMRFEIAMGLRRGEPEFQAEIEAALRKRRDEVRAVLEDYGVPLLDTGPLKTVGRR